MQQPNTTAPPVSRPAAATVTQAPPNLEGLPPAIAASIAKLAGMGGVAPKPDDKPPLSGLRKKVAGQ